VVGDFLVGPEHATEILREMREQGHAEIGAHLHPLTEALAGSVGERPTASARVADSGGVQQLLYSSVAVQPDDVDALAKRAGWC